MKLIIDIDDNLFTRLFNNGDIDAVDMLKACVAICKGIPLPKGHGRLIDADEIQFENAEFDTYGDYSRAFDAIDEAPTIIEADTTECEDKG